MKIALICGGPSLERGISLNSARSVLDHLNGDGIEIVPIYFDTHRNAYHLSQAQLYSNTPSDFDFKLKETAKFLSRTALKALLKSVDLAFPAMHGAFGEDGDIQRLLERYGIPYVGSPASACRRFFDKHEANTFLREQGFFTLPSVLLKIHHSDHPHLIRAFFKQHHITRAIVKPATGGSSIGVFSVSTPKEALEKVRYLFSKRINTRVVIEPFCTGIEFTVILLQNRFNMPVAILPTEIEADYTKHQIFDYRKKYLPTRQVRYHCPPRFDNKTIERIQVQAEQLFTLFGVRDMARFDGWVLPDGKIWFSDFNPISGMEQNSFLFQQTSRIGFSHRDLLRYVVRHACDRHEIPFPALPRSISTKSRKPLQVVFGGKTSERQVSLMSGTNAWLKLRRSEKYDPKPFLLGLHDEIWELPYAFTLSHTVDEIVENCEHAKRDDERLHFLEEKVRLRLALREGEANEPFFLPRKMSLSSFIKNASYVFMGFHGGIGEDGTIQRMLTQAKVPFNGSREKASKICADKLKTGEVLQGLESQGIYSAQKKHALISEFKGWKLNDFNLYFKKLQKILTSRSVIVKPRDEGCSSGIVRLFSGEDLKKYAYWVQKNTPFIPAGVFHHQTTAIEMPLRLLRDIFFERFIETDIVRVKGQRIKWRRKTDWIEVTVGVLEHAGRYHSLSPSLTVAEGHVLSVEEKFQGGTGVNLTPPPAPYVKPAALEKVKRSMELIAQRIGIQGHCRIDTFMHTQTGDVIVIEVNTLPATTPSTVLFHQGLAEEKPVFPRELMERIIRGV
ncbi:MAG: hypothetical protein WCW30_01960 [Candidatus Gracilibacteria bacterium]